MLKKRYFTLIEVMISLFLISIILIFLFNFYKSFTKAQIKLEKISLLVFERNKAYIKLNALFSQIRQKDLLDNCLYLEKDKKNQSPILHISFDNGVDIDPSFSEIVKATLFIDKEKNLYLELFPRNSKLKKTRKELLLKGVDKIEYLFFAQKRSLMEKNIQKKINKDVFIYNDWPKKTSFLPYSVYLKINDKLEFAFFIPNGDIL